LVVNTEGIMHAQLDPGLAGPLEETITLQQAKRLIQRMAHEHSFLLLAPPGVGKSETVYQAAQEAGLPCRSLLGTQIAPEDVSGVLRIVGERSVFCPPRLLLTIGRINPRLGPAATRCEQNVRSQTLRAHASARQRRAAL
jgi:MoxR-like ATPase